MEQGNDAAKLDPLDPLVLLARRAAPPPHRTGRQAPNRSVLPRWRGIPPRRRLSRKRRIRTDRSSSWRPPRPATGFRGCSDRATPARRRACSRSMISAPPPAPSCACVSNPMRARNTRTWCDPSSAGASRTPPSASSPRTAGGDRDGKETSRGLPSSPPSCGLLSVIRLLGTPTQSAAEATFSYVLERIGKARKSIEIHM